MRILISLLILSLLACATPVLAGGWFDSSNKVSVAIGQPAPDFTLKNLEGKDVRLSSYKGQVVFLNFWASWCPPCRAEMPSMERLYEVYGGKKFEMLAVNVEQAEATNSVRTFLKQHPHSFPVLLDDKGAVQELYQVYQYPETFIIGADGKVVDRIIGGRDWASVAMLKSFSDLINGK